VCVREREREEVCVCVCERERDEMGETRWEENRPEWEQVKGGAKEEVFRSIADCSHVT